MRGPDRRGVAAALLGCYLVVLLTLTLVLFRGVGSGINLVPFRTILEDWRLGGHDLVVNFFGNVAAFLPLGALLPEVRRRPTSAAHAAMAGLALSGTIEALQYALGSRVADVDDVILDTLGSLLGFALTARLRARREREKGPRPEDASPSAIGSYPHGDSNPGP